MNPTRPAARPTGGPLATLLVLLLAAALAGGALVATAPAAQAAARVVVSGLGGAARAAADQPTTLTLRGSGFQSVKNAFGGVYVLFGWVSDPSGGSWRPSAGGATGETLRYVPDSEAADNAGYQRFVAFPGSSTAAEANGGTITADGSWSAKLVVPGARFRTVDRSGKTVEVDCTQVRCGVITIGAHGVANAANESFTPVTFDGAGAAASGQASGATAGTAAGTAADEDGDGSSGGSGSGSASGSGSGSGTTAGGAERGTDGAAQDTAGGGRAELPGKATVGVDKATAVAGRVLSFAGQGFEPGEQVVATLDGGVLAVGPLGAGNHGEVAGLLELPSDLRLGTHVLKLTGASSGRTPEVEVTVLRDPAEAEASDALVAAAGAAGGAGPAGPGGLAYSPAELAVGVAFLLLVALVAASAVTGARRRRAARAEAGAAPAESVEGAETSPTAATAGEGA
ncbi:hypothetical protein [Isoptericola sp. NPDC057653]|uniref:hypothetical protein n=1 Tax=Isoptericola sp. NPDC057653 TaxID=3346195 RepID=UPI003690A596